MRRKKQEIKDKEAIENIIKNSFICRLAMLDGEVPYIVPVNYGYEDNAIFIHSAPEGKKIDLLKANNRVCFELEYGVDLIKKEMACDWTTRYKSIIGYGTIEIITDLQGKKHGLDIIMSHNGRENNNVYKEKALDRMVILKLNIQRFTGKQLMSCLCVEDPDLFQQRTMFVVRRYRIAQGLVG